MSRYHLNQCALPDLVSARPKLLRRCPGADLGDVSPSDWCCCCARASHFCCSSGHAAEMTILSLPVELISQICNHLDIQQWFALRLSCRALYERSLEDFAENYYKKIRFIVSSESLHELEELSRSDGLREHVRELWMIPTVFGGTPNFMGMVSVSSKSCQQVKGEELKARYAVHEAMVADNSNLLGLETFSIRLRGCLDRFQKLQIVGLAHYKTEFLLDPRQQTVPFLGRRQMMSRIDFRFDIYSLQSITYTDKESQIRERNSLALSKLFLALCGSSCRPRKLYTCGPDFCGDIGPKIALTEEQYDSLLSALKNIDELHLCIDLQEPAWLKLLKTVAPQLKRLTLSQDHMHAYPEFEENIPTYATKSYTRNMFHGFNFTGLRDLRIHELDTYSDPLKSLLISVKESLAILTLQKIIIRSEKLKVADDSSLQFSEQSGSQENESSSPLMPGAIYPVSFPVPLAPVVFNPPLPLLIPTSPTYTPTVPSYAPTVPSYNPTVPSYTPDLSTSETAPAEIAPIPVQHSLTYELSEPISDQYPHANWRSTYHPYIPQFEIYGNMRTVGPPSEVRHIQPTKTCVSSLLSLFQNELSLQKLKLEDIVCNNTYYCFKKANEIKPTPFVEFDIRSSDMPYSEWVSHLRPVASKPDIFSRQRADEGW